MGLADSFSSVTNPIPFSVSASSEYFNFFGDISGKKIQAKKSDLDLNCHLNTYLYCVPLFITVIFIQRMFSFQSVVYASDGILSFIYFLFLFFLYISFLIFMYLFYIYLLFCIYLLLYTLCPQ